MQYMFGRWKRKLEVAVICAVHHSFKLCIWISLYFSVLAVHVSEFGPIMNLVNLLKFNHLGLQPSRTAHPDSRGQTSYPRLFIPTLILIDPFPLILSSTPHYRLLGRPKRSPHVPYRRPKL